MPIVYYVEKTKEPEPLKKYGKMIEPTSKLLTITTFPNADFTEYFIDSIRCPEQQIHAILYEISVFLAQKKANIVTCRIFMDKILYPLHRDLIKNSFSTISCPITVLCCQKPQTAPEFQVQIHAITSPVLPVSFAGKSAGCRFEDSDAVYYQLSLLPDDLCATPEIQAYLTFKKIQAVLQNIGLDFANTARTWLFADKILSWYDHLNRARDRFFTENDIFNKLVPASTGIGLSNPFGAALTAELLAVQPKKPQFLTEKVDSPLQCSALNYRSSFSRAVQVRTSQNNRLYISGTASIDANGKTVFLDDPLKQIEQTMAVVEAILRSRQMDWSHTVRNIAYFKSKNDFHLFDDFCRRHHITISHIKVEADVCRDNLLFELETDAIITH